MPFTSTTSFLLVSNLSPSSSLSSFPEDNNWVHIKSPSLRMSFGTPASCRAAQCCDAFKAEVSFCRYLIGLFGCQGALDWLSPVFRQWKKPDAPTERCSLNRLDSVFATYAFAILLNILRRMHPAWNHFSYLCEASLPHIKHFSALFRFWPWQGMSYFRSVSSISLFVFEKNSKISKEKRPDMACQELAKCFSPRHSTIIYSWQTIVHES